MTDLADLVRAVVENPKEDTPKAMLADHLLEQGDGRGDLLHWWLAHPEDRLTGQQWYGRDMRHPITDNDSYLRQLITHLDPNLSLEPGHKLTGMATTASATPGDSVLFHLTHQLPSAEADPQTLSVPSHSIIVRVPLAETRHIADTLPDSDRFRNFLNEHYGPDPRFTEDLNKTLKPKGE